jgi:Domain of unknown function (DUF4253)
MNLLGAIQDAGVNVDELRVIEAGGTAIAIIDVPGSAAIGSWQALRAAVTTTGHWPVVLGGEDEVERLSERLGYADGSPANVLAAAEQLLPHAHAFLDAGGADRDLAGRLGLVVEDYEDGELAEMRDGGSLDENIPEDAQPIAGFTVPLDILTGKPRDVVNIALVPCREGWQVPAYLAVGGWNECPPVETQAALHRAWNERYGAEIVCVSSDVIECRVVRPPVDDVGALTLARAQYMYCKDIVDQGVDTVGALAGALRGARQWYFWWD